MEAFLGLVNDLQVNLIQGRDGLKMPKMYTDVLWQWEPVCILLRNQDQQPD